MCHAYSTCYYLAQTEWTASSTGPICVNTWLWRHSHCVTGKWSLSPWGSIDYWLLPVRNAVVRASLVEEGLTDWVPALNYCFVRSPSINSSVSAHGENTAIIRSTAHIPLSLLLALPPVCLQPTHLLMTSMPRCPSWKKQTNTSCFPLTAPLTGWNPNNLWVQGYFTFLPFSHCKFDSTMLIQEAKIWLLW